jgi:hypothetical protein
MPKHRTNNSRTRIEIDLKSMLHYSAQAKIGRIIFRNKKNSLKEDIHKKSGYTFRFIFKEFQHIT